MSLNWISSQYLLVVSGVMETAKMSSKLVLHILYCVFGVIGTEILFALEPHINDFNKCDHILENLPFKHKF